MPMLSTRARLRAIGRELLRVAEADAMLTSSAMRSPPLMMPEDFEDAEESLGRAVGDQRSPAPRPSRPRSLKLVDERLGDQRGRPDAQARAHATGRGRPRRRAPRASAARLGFPQRFSRPHRSRRRHPAVHVPLCSLSAISLLAERRDHLVADRREVLDAEDRAERLAGLQVHAVRRLVTVDERVRVPSRLAEEDLVARVDEELGVRATTSTCPASRPPLPPNARRARRTASAGSGDEFAAELRVVGVVAGEHEQARAEP
jgi:hypothetical protein